jgi:adenosine/AMP kinase
MVRLVSFLSEGGWLAVQMPNNIHELSHALMRMVAADGPWASRLILIAKTRAVIGALDVYYQLLTRVCSRVDIWQTTYVHPLDGPDDIVEWFHGSGLRPFLEPLSPCEREALSCGSGCTAVLVRSSGTDAAMVQLAQKNAMALGAGHCFIVFLGEGYYPVNVLNAIKMVPEVCRIFCATANPVEVVVAETDQGRGLLGVIDGLSPKGIEGEDDIAWRKNLLRQFGYKL